MSQSHPVQFAILQVTLHGIKFRHAVADRRARCKCNAFPAGDFIQILAFVKHICRFLCFILGNACHIPHFCVKECIFVIMSFIHIQTVYPQFFKRYHIILFLFVLQLFQTPPETLFGLFQLFYRKTAAITFQLCLLNSCFQFFDLLFYDLFLAFFR